MRIQRILVGAALLVLFAAVAQADVRISSVITAEVIQTGNAELVGDVELWVKEQPAVADVITVTYGGLPITIGAGASGIQIDPASTWACTIVSPIDYVNGIITLNCPASALDTYVRIKGVRVQVSGYTGNTVYAELGTLNNTIWAGMDTTKIVKQIGPGLVAGTGETAYYLANGYDIEYYGYWTLTEGFASAWKTVTQAGTGATNGVEITLRLTGLPTGMTVGVGFDGYSSTLGVGLSGNTFTKDTTERVITFSATDQSAIEEIDLYFWLDGYSGNLMQAASYKIQATLSPIQAGLKSGVPYSPGAKYPKFNANLLPADGFTVLSIMPNTTSLLVPYVSEELGYHTGLAIANTTKDIWTDDEGGAVEQEGYITVTFYPNDGGAAIVYSTKTDAVKGKGLTSGVLKAGSTWTVLASELLAAKGRTSAFSGYAIITTEFTNAHGASYISNFDGFTSGSPILVLVNPQVYGRSWLSTERPVF